MKAGKLQWLPFNSVYYKGERGKELHYQYAQYALVQKFWLSELKSNA